MVGFSLQRPVWPHPLMFRRAVVVLAGLVPRLDWFVMGFWVWVLTRIAP